MTAASTVHLLSAADAWDWRSTRVSVCGELVTVPPRSEDDPRYGPQCVGAAVSWNVQAVRGSAWGRRPAGGSSVSGWTSGSKPTFANAVDLLFIIVAIFTAAEILLAMFFPSGRASTASAAPKTEMLAG